VPNRHFSDFSDISTEELAEFLKTLSYVKKTLASAKLKQPDGKPIDRYLFFWRYRENSLDPIENVIKPDHFHFHIAPEKEHLWDSVCSDDATGIDIECFKKLFNKIN